MLQVIATAYRKPVYLRIFIDSFIVQTCPEWSLIIIHDGPAHDDMLKIVSQYKNDKRITFIATDHRVGNWGNENRQVMLQLIEGKKGDFVLMTNGDNVYVPFFVKMVKERMKPGVGFIFYDFLHHPFDYGMIRSRPELNWIDLGAFVTELKLAKSIGFNRITESGADGKFAMEAVARCKREGLQVIKIDKCLLIHN
jgi:glycosyltransferase involved in cell wall biosynthesis